MTGVLLLAMIASGGVLLAVTAVAIKVPTPAAEAIRAAGTAVPAIGARLKSPTLRDRVNRPLQALAEGTQRRRRLNAGLTLAEHLARADL